MTTPEKLKRRQMIEGGILVLIGVVMVVQSIYFSAKIADQSDCVAGKFEELSAVLDVRGEANARISELEEQKSDLTKNAMLAFSDAAETPEADNQAALIAALLKYKADINDVDDELQAEQQKLKNNPLPPYPVGACDR